MTCGIGLLYFFPKKYFLGHQDTIRSRIFCTPFRQAAGVPHRRCSGSIPKSHAPLTFSRDSASDWSPVSRDAATEVVAKSARSAVPREGRVEHPTWSIPIRSGWRFARGTPGESGPMIYSTSSRPVKRTHVTGPRDR